MGGMKAVDWLEERLEFEWEIWSGLLWERLEENEWVRAKECELGFEWDEKKEHWRHCLWEKENMREQMCSASLMANKMGVEMVEVEYHRLW